MEQNLYAPPEALVLDVPAGSVLSEPEFYVVSKTKFLVLFFATLGLYQLYWFYAHWARWRETHRESIWPVWRSIFAVFFTHRLAREMEGSLRRAGCAHEFPAAFLATTAVALMIISNVGARWTPETVDGWVAVEAMSTFMMLAMGYVLWQMQHAANTACGDPGGTANARFTWANALWLALGAVAWFGTLLGYAEVAGLVTIPE